MSDLPVWRTKLELIIESPSDLRHQIDTTIHQSPSLRLHLDASSASSHVASSSPWSPLHHLCHVRGGFGKSRKQMWVMSEPIQRSHWLSAFSPMGCEQCSSIVLVMQYSSSAERALSNRSNIESISSVFEDVVMR